MTTTFPAPDPTTRRSFTHDGVNFDYGFDEDGAPEDQRHCVVWVKDASLDSVLTVLAAPDTDHTEAYDGRSGWRWFRFPDGTLVLGVYPQGDIYSATEGDHSS